MAVYLIFTIWFKILTLSEVNYNRFVFSVSSCFEYLEIDIIINNLGRESTFSFKWAIENRVISVSWELDFEHFLEYWFSYFSDLLVGEFLVLIHNIIFTCSWDTIMMLQIWNGLCKLLKQLIRLSMLPWIWISNIWRSKCFSCCIKISTCIPIVLLMERISCIVSSPIKTAIIIPNRHNILFPENNWLNSVKYLAH